MQIEQARSDMHRQVDERMDALVAALRGATASSAPPRRPAVRVPYAPPHKPSDIDRAKARAALARMGLCPRGES